MARGEGDEVWRLRYTDRHYLGNSGRSAGWLDFWNVGYLGGRRIDRWNHCVVHRRGDTGLDHALVEKGVRLVWRGSFAKFLFPACKKANRAGLPGVGRPARLASGGKVNSLACCPPA